MKKLLVLVFALAMLCGLFFAFNVNAADDNLVNITSQVTPKASGYDPNDPGKYWWTHNNVGNLVDGDKSTGMHSSNKEATTTITFDLGGQKRVAKFVMFVNGTATTSAMSHTDLNAGTTYTVTIGSYTAEVNAKDKRELVFDGFDVMTDTITVSFYSGWSANSALIREVEVYEYVPPVEEVVKGKNIEDEATIAITDGNNYITATEYLVDNDPSTGLSAGNAASWINYHFLYTEGRDISRVVVVVNSTGTMYNVGSADGTYVHETMSTLPNIYLRLYSSTSGAESVYKLEKVSTSAAVEVTKNGKTYMAYTFDLGKYVYTDIVKVEVATVHEKNNKLGVWEVEIFEHECKEDADHDYLAATCVTPSTCRICGATKGAVSSEHTWLSANCGQPERCVYCTATQGEPTNDPHIWINASYTAPKTCRVCGSTEGDVWVDSTANNYYRGPENDVITFGDLIGDVELIAGGTDYNTREHGGSDPWAVLDGDYTTHWASKGTGGTIKITLKNEWEITDIKAMLAGNYCFMSVTLYAADGTKIGKTETVNVQVNSGLLEKCAGKDSSNGVYSDFNGAINGVAYGDKAVKYIVIKNEGHKWEYLPNAWEFVIKGRERIPTNCVEHKYVSTYPVVPTCTTAGTLVKTCSECGATEAPVVAPALGHRWDTYTIDVPATCISAPVLKFTCVGCGEIMTRSAQVDNIIEYANKYSIQSDASGGGTYWPEAFDGNLETGLIPNQSWRVEGSIAFDMPYYLSSVTLWLKGASQEATLIVFYQAPGSEEWIPCGTMNVASPLGEVNVHTLELTETVYASAIKVFIGKSDYTERSGVGLYRDWNGVLYEVAVAGSIVPETATGHNWVAGETVAPTCQSNGYTPYTCSVCDATKNDNFILKDAKYHPWAAASCVAPKTCELCGATEGDKLPHTEETIPAVDATCTATGLTAGVKCSVCNLVITAQEEVATTDHSMNAATCTAPASCANCDYTEGEALGHSMKDATCTAPKTCATCGATEGEALGQHIYDLSNAVTDGNVVTIACTYGCGAAATITVNGTMAQAGFNMMMQQAVVSVYAPSYGKLTAVASEGSVCLLITNPRIPAQPFTAPMIVNIDGFNDTYVIVPQFSATDAAPSITITYEELTPATIVEGDNTVDTSMGDTKVQFVVPADGKYTFTTDDSFDIFVIGEYGSENAYETEFTFVEGQVVVLIIKSYGAPSVPVNAAKVVEHVCEYTVSSTTAPTCTAAGTTTYTCTCGKTYTEETAVALGHNEVEIPAEPGYRADGVVYPGKTSGVKCSECGEIIVPQADASKKFDISGASLTLTQDITINYTITIPAGYTDVYAIFSLMGVDNFTPITVYEENANTGKDRTVTFKFPGLKFFLMNETVETMLYATTADGQTVTFKNDVMSVAFYSSKTLIAYESYVQNGNATAIKLSTVISDLLIAGDMTQKYENYKTNALVSEAVKATGATLRPSKALADVKVPESGFTFENNEQGKDTRWSGASLYIGDATYLKLMFNAKDIEGLQVKITIGKRTSYIVNAEDLGEPNSSGQYTVQVEGILAKEYGTTVKAEFLKDGEPVENGAVIYSSINIYLYMMHNNSNAKVKNLTRALYNYGVSVLAYETK